MENVVHMADKAVLSRLLRCLILHNLGQYMYQKSNASTSGWSITDQQTTRPETRHLLLYIAPQPAHPLLAPTWVIATVTTAWADMPLALAELALVTMEGMGTDALACAHTATTG